jgi:hypothetical protein
MPTGILAANIIYSPHEPYNAQAWGMVADYNGLTGTDNTAAFDAALAAAIATGQRLYIPAGRYYFANPVTIPQGTTNNIVRIEGETPGNVGYGYKGTWLEFAAGGIVQHNVGQIYYNNIGIHTLASAGPAIDWNDASGTTLDGVAIISDNPNQPLINSTGAGIERNTIRNFDFTPAGGHTAPVISLVTTSNGIIANKIMDGTIHGSGSAMAPQIVMQCGSSGGCYGNKLESVIFEVPRAGAILLSSMAYTTLINLWEGDVSPFTLTAPVVQFDETVGVAQPQPSYYNVLIGCNMGDGNDNTSTPTLLVHSSSVAGGDTVAVGGLLPYIRNTGVAPPVTIFAVGVADTTVGVSGWQISSTNVATLLTSLTISPNEGGISLGGIVPQINRIDTGDLVGFQANVGAGRTHYISTYAGTFRIVTPVGEVVSWNDTTGLFSVEHGLSTTTIATATNCSSSASPAVCSSAASGSVMMMPGATTVVVNTTAVTDNSQILVTFDASLGNKLGVTCNTTVPSLYGVAARNGGDSFTISGTAPETNPACFSYSIIN